MSGVPISLFVNCIQATVPSELQDRRLSPKIYNKANIKKISSKPENEIIYLHYC